MWERGSRWSAHDLKDEKTLERVATDRRTADTLTERQKALCRYAERLTVGPASSSAETVQALRAAGLDDTEVLQATLVVAYFIFMDRTVLGLGVPLEDEQARSGYKY